MTPCSVLPKSATLWTDLRPISINRKPLQVVHLAIHLTASASFIPVKLFVRKILAPLDPSGCRQREMAGHGAAVLARNQQGPFAAAAVLRHRAARMKPAAAGRVDRAGHIAGQDDPLAGTRRIVRLGHGGNQRLGIGMRGRVKDILAAPISTIEPRYITAIRVETWRTTLRSCATKT